MIMTSILGKLFILLLDLYLINKDKAMDIIHKQDTSLFQSLILIWPKIVFDL